MQIHPNDLFLRETFLEPGGHCQRVLSHVRECSQCQERLKSLLTSYWSRKPPDYEPALNRSFSALQQWQRMYAKERVEAPRLLTALLDQPVERQRLLLRNHARFQTWSLCEALLYQSHERVFTDAAESEDLAQHALFLSNHLNSALYGSERIEDLRARAWGYIANSRRVRHDLAASTKAFEAAFLHLRQGTGDMIEKVTLLELKALFLRVQRQFSECKRLLQRAVSVLREMDDSDSASRCLEALAGAYYFQGEFENAIQGAQEAIALLNPVNETRTLLCARHNFALYLAAAGRVMEAQRWLIRARPLYQQFSDPVTQSRLKWVEATIARGLGRYREARVLFQAAHDGFLAANLPYDATLASLEITSLPDH